MAFACVSFLTVSLSGFHLHADIGSHEELSSHVHGSHHAASHDIDHVTDHVDIAVFEAASSFSKAETCAPCATTFDLALMPEFEGSWPSEPPDQVLRFDLRLRPALRAPPISA